MVAPDQPGEGERSFQRSLFSEEPVAPAADPSVFPDCRVDRIRPPVKAHGGKYYLAPRIVPILLNVRAKVTEYLEPCAFGGSVFLAMPRMQRGILGDINPDVVALWTVLSKRDTAMDLSRRLAAVPYTDETFQAAKRDTGVTQIERATRFLIRCRFSRGGLGKDFAWSERLRGGRPGDENAWHTFRENELPKIIGRAEGVEVLNDPCWRTVWQSRNTIQRLIYADPPYIPKTRTAKTAYGPFEMTPYQHARLITALQAHGGPARSVAIGATNMIGGSVVGDGSILKCRTTRDRARGNCGDASRSGSTGNVRCIIATSTHRKRQASLAVAPAAGAALRVSAPP